MAVEDPSQPINLAEHPAIQQPREHLPKDLTDWLAGGDWKGVQEALVWEEGRSILSCSIAVGVAPSAGLTDISDDTRSDDFRG